MAQYQSVLRTPELGPGEMREVEADGHSVLLANVGQTYYAVQAHCPNEGTNLAQEGRLNGDILICPNDDWAYDIRTGERLRPPGGTRLRRYALRVEGNMVQIGPPVDEGGRYAA